MRSRSRECGGLFPSGKTAAALPMEVLFLTTLFSVLFAIFFLALFFRSRQDGRSCSDQDALLPFRDDPPAATISNNHTTRPNTDHDA